MNNTIDIYGAREHNLKDITTSIPKNKLVVVTGISGSGKSTFAFDTLYAEGQRRYIESLSSYARQFLDKTSKPDVDKIEGLTPAIAIDQKTTSKNPRSTVGTITEIYDYLRVMFARIGVQHCHSCGKPISQMLVSDIIEQVLALPTNAKIVMLGPIIKEKKGSFTDIIENFRSKGYVRAMIDGVMVRLDEEIELAKNKKHTIKVVIDRVVIKEENNERIASGVEKALKESFGELEVDVINNEEVGCAHHIHYSEHFACFDCKISFEELEPLSFSFNSPKGACPSCDGLGIRYTIDLDKVINEDLTVENGAIRIFHGFNKSYYSKLLQGFCKANEIPINVPFRELEEHHRKAILYGNATPFSFTWKRHKINKSFDGMLKMAHEMFKDDKDVSSYMSEKPCDTCNSHRLKQESLAVKVAGRNIGDILDMPIESLHHFFQDKSILNNLKDITKKIASPVIKEIKQRVEFLYDVGLGYISLGRDARSISGGEAQRIRIASQIGSGLTGVMYVLDEPSIGLHERDTMKLIKTLKSLQAKGNTVIVVEHDEETIKNADFIVDIGPGAGKFGGDVIFNGTYNELLKSDTLTAQYINKTKTISHIRSREQKDFISMKNVNINNIKNLNVKIPLRNLVSITGVSGSGKSSLIIKTLLPTAKELLNRARKVDKIKGVSIKGLDELDKVIYLDQSPIGRTPRSNPATYTGIMDEIRGLFAQTKESKIRGYKIGRYSFNVKGGRCEKCQGDGSLKIEMHFLPDVIVKCDSCNGTRYNAQTLQIHYKGKNISDVLNMSVNEAVKFFEHIPKIYTKLKTLKDVGLDYITLGQSAVTLSGGEAQRIKLSKELSKKDTGNTLYILDEPTTGLHFADIDRLTGVLQHLVDLGNSVVVIEHNLDVIKNSDYIIDMGHEGGDKGGQIIAYGTPNEIVKKFKKSGSYTGEYLSKVIS